MHVTPRTSRATIEFIVREGAENFLDERQKVASAKLENSLDERQKVASAKLENSLEKQKVASAELENSLEKELVLDERQRVV